jgi:hypothetical protein
VLGFQTANGVRQAKLELLGAERLTHKEAA